MNEKTILLQRYLELGGLGREEAAIQQYAILNREPYAYAEEELLGEYPSKMDIKLYVGSVEGTEIVLNAMGHKLPLPDYYPAALKQYYSDRNLRQGTIHDIKAIIDAGGSVFAKPYYNWKSFTGQVFNNSNDLAIFESIDYNLKVWLANPIEMVAEFRAYVVQNKLVAVCQYTNDDDFTIDESVITNAIKQLINTGYPWDTYAFDWCITNKGTTELVEMNNAFAIGKYKEISVSDYYEFLQRGWENLINPRG